jgi:hypothetical protein
MFEIQAGGYMVFRGSRQISKSTSFSCRQQLMARLFPGFKSLYVVPRNQQLKTYQYKMREIENAMAGVAKANEPQLRNNLGYKQFANGSTIESTYVLSSASSIRGKSAYLKHGRPRCECRQVFLRLPAPHKGIVGPTISGIVQRC